MKRLLPLAIACLLAAVVVAVPSAVARSSATDSSVSAADQQYLKTSISGDLFEIIGGKYAQRHSHNAAVRRLANRLVKDHTKSLQDAVNLAHSLGIDVPKAPTASMIWELKIVTALRGKTFNHWYSSLEVYDHVQDISEATDEVNNGSNKQIRDDAATELPTLRIHLRLARQALAANPKG